MRKAPPFFILYRGVKMSSLTVPPVFATRIHENRYAGMHVEGIQNWPRQVLNTVIFNLSIKQLMMQALEQLSRDLASHPPKLDERYVEDLTEKAKAMTITEDPPLSTQVDENLTKDLINELITMSTAEDPPLPTEVDGQTIPDEEIEQMRALLLTTAKESVATALRSLSTLSAKDIEAAIAAKRKEDELRKRFQEDSARRAASDAEERKRYAERIELANSLETTYNLVPGMLDVITESDALHNLAAKLEQRADQITGLFQESEKSIYFSFFALCHIKSPAFAVVHYTPWIVYNAPIRKLFENAPFMKKMLEFFPENFKDLLCRMPHKGKQSIIRDLGWIKELILQNPISIRKILLSTDRSTQSCIELSRKFFHTLIKSHPQHAAFCLKYADRWLQREIREDMRFLCSVIESNMDHIPSLLKLLPKESYMQDSRRLFHALIKSHPQHAASYLEYASPWLRRDIRKDTKFLCSVIKENPAHIVSILSISYSFKNTFCSTKYPYLLEVLQTVKKEELEPVLQAAGHLPISNKTLAFALAQARPEDIRLRKRALFHPSLLKDPSFTRSLRSILSRWGT